VVQRLFFYTSKTGLGFQLIFKADRPASYGRRSVSHLLVSSWRILWSELHDPAFGNGGVGGGEMCSTAESLCSEMLVREQTCAPSMGDL